MNDAVNVIGPKGGIETLQLRDLMAAFIASGAMAQRSPRLLIHYQAEAADCYRMADVLLSAREWKLAFDENGMAIPPQR